MESSIVAQTTSFKVRSAFRTLTRIRKVSSNSLIAIYEKQTILPWLSIGWIGYYFRNTSSGRLLRLTKRNLIQSYRHTEFENELKLFLKSSQIRSIDRFTGELIVLKIINPDTYKRVYQLLKYQTKFENNSIIYGK